MQFSHVPVMLEECMDALNLKPTGIYFDGTLGGSGHSYEILKRSKGGSLIATDLDLTALAVAKDRLKEFEGKTTLVHDNFKNFKFILDELGINEIDGALLDLGVSSYQLDERSRGFSYMARDARLDMRMNSDATLSAYEVVNEYSEKKLKEILYLYGEERFSANIARNIVNERAKKPITTTGELVDIIEKSIPAKFKKDGHPAKRTFQAIRIEVNGELTGLDEVLHDIADKLKKGGRLTPAVAMIGTLLKIKPVLQIQGDKLDQYAKVRKLVDAKATMINALKKDLETRFKEYADAGKISLAVAHTQNLNEAERFAQEIKEIFPNLEISYIDPLSLSVSCHIGPGALAVACSIKY